MTSYSKLGPYWLFAVWAHRVTPLDSLLNIFITKRRPLGGRPEYGRSNIFRNTCPNPFCYSVAWWSDGRWLKRFGVRLTRQIEMYQRILPIRNLTRQRQVFHQKSAMVNSSYPNANRCSWRSPNHLWISLARDVLMNWFGLSQSWNSMVALIPHIPLRMRTGPPMPGNVRSLRESI